MGKTKVLTTAKKKSEKIMLLSEGIFTLEISKKRCRDHRMMKKAVENKTKLKTWNKGWLVGFYGISIFVAYLTPNPFLCKETVLFETIQFNMSTQFNCLKHSYFNLFSLFKQF